MINLLFRSMFSMLNIKKVFGYSLIIIHQSILVIIDKIIENI